MDDIADSGVDNDGLGRQSGKRVRGKVRENERDTFVFENLKFFAKVCKS